MLYHASVTFFVPTRALPCAAPEPHVSHTAPCSALAALDVAHAAARKANDAESALYSYSLAVAFNTLAAAAVLAWSR